MPTLLQHARTDKRYLFKGPDDLIARSQAALARAKDRIHDWFGLLPKADVVIERYPKFREKNGPNEYNPPAEDGSRPAVFFINAYEAEKKSRVEAESTAFHETIPGHHLQGAIALERKEHPSDRPLSGQRRLQEGWALYAERLADEMKLFSADLDRLGMLSSQALRAVRLVVDSGIHTLGWTRQQAIDYMLAHTAEDRADVASEVDRYIIYPGQATAYMLGKLEISKARDDAQQAMGARFDIKQFHDRVLEDGAIPVQLPAREDQAHGPDAMIERMTRRRRDRGGDGGVADRRLAVRQVSAGRQAAGGDRPTRFDVQEKTIAELQAALTSGAVTSRSLVLAYLARIRAYDLQGPQTELR